MGLSLILTLYLNTDYSPKEHINVLMYKIEMRKELTFWRKAWSTDYWRYLSHPMVVVCVQWCWHSFSWRKYRLYITQYQKHTYFACTIECLFPFLCDVRYAHSVKTHTGCSGLQESKWASVDSVGASSSTPYTADNIHTRCSIRDVLTRASYISDCCYMRSAG